MGFVFSLLSPQPSSVVWQWFCRAVGVIGLGPAFAAAVVANTTKEWQGTVDFLGFTVVAEKPD
jgi:ligand-binding SRPBCC domain-containing protein